MVDWLKSWANSIIVAIIIAVIFELIIPNGNNKKYIKMVINLYVLYVILNPLILKFTKFNSKNIVDDINNKYFNSSYTVDTSTKLNTDTLVNITAQNTIKENIKNKLSLEGYKVLDISINMNSEDGHITNIKLSVEKDKSIIDAQNNISINQINEINISNNSNNNETKLKKKDILNIKSILKKEYEISEDNIEINE